MPLKNYKRPWVAVPIMVVLNILVSPVWLAVIALAVWGWAVEEETEQKGS